MYDEIAKLVVFIITGSVFWIVSQRLYISEYPLKKVERFDHGYLFVALGLAVTYDIIVAPIFLAVMDQSHQIIPSIRHYLAKQPVLLQMLIYLLMSDFLAYWAHRLLHTSYMWKFHVLHHSPISLNWISGMRGSPVHYILIFTPELIVASMFILTNNSWMLPVLATIGLLNQHMIHTNIRLPLAKQIEYVFVTPRMHFVHHHPNLPYTNRNYGFVFSIWDRIFGTYIDAEEVKEKGLLGTDYMATKWEMFVGLTPKNIASE